MHFYRLPALTHEFEVGLPVNTIALSKHGLMAVSTLSPKNTASSQEAKALIFDLKSSDVIHSVVHDRAINSAEISPDGQWLLTASEDSKARISRIHAEDTLDLSVLFDDPMRPVRKAFYSHSGSRVGIVVHERIYLVDALTGETLRTFQANDWYPSAEFSKDDRYVVAAGSDKTAKIYHSETGQVLAVSKAAGWVWNAKLSPDGRYLAGLSWDNKLRISETVRSEEGEIEGLRDFMELDLAIAGEHLEFSPDSRYLSFSLWGGDSFFLDMSSRNLRKLPCVQKGFSSAPVFSDNSQLMAVGHNSMAYLYKVPELKPVQTIAHAARVTSLGFLNDQFFSGSWDGKVKSTPINLTNKASCVFVSQ
jgi:WD40 repeat protein